jgi:hypothetical protein
MVETLSQLAIVANRGRLLIPGRQVGYAEQFTSMIEIVVAAAPYAAPRQGSSYSQS